MVAVATKPIPPGTVNVAINMAREFRLDVGKLAYTEGKSIGQLVRELLAERIQQARHAGRLAKHAAGAALVAIGIGALAWCSISPASGLVARRVRTSRGRCVASASFASRIRQTRAAA